MLQGCDRVDVQPLPAETDPQSVRRSHYPLVCQLDSWRVETLSLTGWLASAPLHIGCLDPSAKSCQEPRSEASSQWKRPSLPSYDNQRPGPESDVSASTKQNSLALWLHQPAR